MFSAPSWLYSMGFQKSKKIREEGILCMVNEIEFATKYKSLRYSLQIIYIEGMRYILYLVFLIYYMHPYMHGIVSLTVSRISKDIVSVNVYNEMIILILLPSRHAFEVLFFFRLDDPVIFVGRNIP